MNITDLYYHPHLGHLVQITAIEGNWVEFLNKSTRTLAWLERPVFEFAYTYKNEGDPINVDLMALRQAAHQSGILIPWEFGQQPWIQIED